MRNRLFYRPLVLVAVLVCLAHPAHPCSWAIGDFHQVTRLHGTVVGMNRGWPRWMRQRVARDNVNLRLYAYRWPLHERSEMPLVKSVRTDNSRQFDFGILPEGHYILL